MEGARCAVVAGCRWYFPPFLECWRKTQVVFITRSLFFAFVFSADLHSVSEKIMKVLNCSSRHVEWRWWLCFGRRSINFLLKIRKQKKFTIFAKFVIFPPKCASWHIEWGFHNSVEHFSTKSWKIYPYWFKNLLKFPEIVLWDLENAVLTTLSKFFCRKIKNFPSKSKNSMKNRKSCPQNVLYHSKYAVENYWYEETSQIRSQ